MARTRSSKSFTKDLKTRRLEGPTCLWPLTKERLAAKHPPPQVRLPVVKIPTNRAPGLQQYVQTTYTLNILPEPDVSIINDLEPAIRAISSPSGNFIWGHIKIVKTSGPSPGTVVDGAADSNLACLPLMSPVYAQVADEIRVKDNALQIILIHNNYNHNGNVHYQTAAMFQPTPWEPRDLLLEEQEVIGIEQILSEIRGWKDKVQSCAILNARVREQPIMVAKGPAFPNGMGNEKRFPPPWDAETWHKRVEERKRKRLAYNAARARKLTKVSEIYGHTEDGTHNGTSTECQPTIHGIFDNILSVINTPRRTISNTAVNHDWR